MGEIDVRADGEHRYAAALTTSAGSTTEHSVVSDTDLLERLHATDADEPFLVRRVLEVLLEAAENSDAAVPAVVDLRALDAERPDLLPSLPLR